MNENLFMDIEIKTCLYDILNAITEINSFFEDQPKEFEVYKTIQEQEELLKEISRSSVKRQTEFFKKTKL